MDLGKSVSHRKVGFCPDSQRDTKLKVFNLPLHDENKYSINNAGSCAD